MRRHTRVFAREIAVRNTVKDASSVDASILYSIYSYIIAIIAFIVWLCSFSYNNEIKKINFDIEMVGFIFYGIVVFLVLTFVRDTFYYVPLLIFTPLIIAYKLDLKDLDLALIIMFGLSLLGIIALIMTLIANRIVDTEFISDTAIMLMVVASILIEIFGAFGYTLILFSGTKVFILLFNVLYSVKKPNNLKRA